MVSHKSYLKIFTALILCIIINWLLIERSASHLFVISYIVDFLCILYISTIKKIIGDHVYTIVGFVTIKKYCISDVTEISWKSSQTGKAAYWFELSNTENAKFIFGTTDTNLDNIFKYIVKNSRYSIALDASALALVNKPD